MTPERTQLCCKAIQRARGGDRPNYSQAMLSLLTIAGWKGGGQYRAVPCPNGFGVIFAGEKR
jgi:hypothetical protein